MKKLTIKLLFIVFAFLTLSCSTSKKASKSKKGAIAMAKPPEKKLNKNDIQPYSKIITKKAKTDKGLFDVHQIDDNYFYEIPDSLFDREMLMVTRIAKTASGLGFGGGKLSEQVLRWQKKR